MQITFEEVLSGTYNACWMLQSHAKAVRLAAEITYLGEFMLVVSSQIRDYEVIRGEKSRGDGYFHFGMVEGHAECPIRKLRRNDMYFHLVVSSG